VTQIADRTAAATTVEDAAGLYQLPPASRIGHTHLRVADLKRSLAFYRDVLGFSVTYETETIAMLAAGGYHHHVGMNTWDSLGGARPPLGTTGLHHHAIVLPDRRSLAVAVKRVIDSGHQLTDAQDHGVSEAYYLDDPDGNGVELYIDRPSARWPFQPDGSLGLYSVQLEVADLMVELEPSGGARAEELADRFRAANADFAGFVNSMTDADWAAPCPKESTTVGVAAHHVAAAYPAVLAKLEAQHRGESVQKAPQELLDEANARHNAAFTGVSVSDVLDDLREGAAPVAAAIRLLTDADLDRPLVDGAGSPLVLFEAWVRNVAIGQIGAHRSDLVEALATVDRR
jgi:catechol 2,3-dioxygenase